MKFINVISFVELEYYIKDKLVQVVVNLK